MQVLIYLAAVALVLGVLVFVHEFGHYAVAKLCGVRVEVFSLGFGKRLVDIPTSLLQHVTQVAVHLRVDPGRIWRERRFR